MIQIETDGAGLGQQVILVFCCGRWPVSVDSGCSIVISLMAAEWQRGLTEQRSRSQAIVVEQHVEEKQQSLEPVWDRMINIQEQQMYESQWSSDWLAVTKHS